MLVGERGASKESPVEGRVGDSGEVPRKGVVELLESVLLCPEPKDNPGII